MATPKRTRGTAPTAEPGEVVRGSGNVFADIGLPDAEDMFLKAQLALLIAKTIKAHGFSQRKAADVTGIPQPDINAIVNGRLVGFSAFRLLKALRALGKSVELHIRDEGGEDFVLAV